MITCSFVSYNGSGADTSAECVESIYKIRDTRQLPSVAGACVCVSVSARLEVPAQYVDITVVSSFVCSLILWLSRFRLRTPSLPSPSETSYFTIRFAGITLKALLHFNLHISRTGIGSVSACDADADIKAEKTPHTLTIM